MSPGAIERLRRTDASARGAVRSGCYGERVHHCDQLPGRRTRDDHVVRHGYAVGVSGAAYGQTWWFFEDLEPALAFGRAARMSVQASGYGVYRGASEQRFMREYGGDVWSLWLTGDSLDREAGEREHLRTWVDGVSEDSSYWNRPSGRRKAGGR